jgi:hypothetical protein
VRWLGSATGRASCTLRGWSLQLIICWECGMSAGQGVYSLYSCQSCWIYGGVCTL